MKHATREGRIIQTLMHLVEAKDGNRSAELWEHTEKGRRCRLCYENLGGPQGTGTAFIAKLYKHREDTGHNEAAGYIIDNSLHVPNHNCQKRLRKLAFGIDVLASIEVVMSFHVFVGPKWFKDLVGGWGSDALVRKVIERARRDCDWRDALDAAADVDGDAVDVLVAQHYPGEMHP